MLLREHIAKEIRRHGGWISFARYMELALHAPGLGYYASGAQKFGAHGDFVTAPELAKNEGSIVNIVDIHAERPLKGYPVYSIAKAGLAAMTRALALELAPRVRVNGVAPGAVAWPEDGQLESAERSRILATTPLGHMGTPEDIAQAVHFLACAPYITGQILAVDGGRSIFL